MQTTLAAISDALQSMLLASFNTSQNALAASLCNERAVSWTLFATLLRSPASTFIREACARSSDHQEDLKAPRVVTLEELYEAGQKMYLRCVLGRRTLKFHYYMASPLDCYHLAVWDIKEIVRATTRQKCCDNAQDEQIDLHNTDCKRYVWSTLASTPRIWRSRNLGVWLV